MTTCWTSWVTISTCNCTIRERWWITGSTSESRVIKSKTLSTWCTLSISIVASITSWVTWWAISCTSRRESVVDTCITSDSIDLETSSATITLSSSIVAILTVGITSLTGCCSIWIGSVGTSCASCIIRLESSSTRCTESSRSTTCQAIRTTICTCCCSIWESSCGTLWASSIVKTESCVACETGSIGAIASQTSCAIGAWRLSSSSWESICRTGWASVISLKEVASITSRAWSSGRYTCCATCASLTDLTIIC